MTNVKPSESTGREFSPTYIQGREVTRNTKESFDQKSKASLDAIIAKHCSPTKRKLILTVNSKLEVHSHII